MNEKEFKDCVDKLVKATNSLSDVVDKMGKTIDKMVDYCILLSSLMFIIVIIVILF